VPAVPDHLAVESRHAGERIVLLHGFTQTRRSWAATMQHLAERAEVVAVDAPGHGDSAAIRADVVRAAALLVAAGGAATYVGYSMGGRIALRAALDHPSLVRRLVLVSSTAGIADPSERAARRAADDVLADGIERDGVAAFVDRWLAGPLFATLPADRAGRADRTGNDAGGLAASLRQAGAGTQEPLWERLPELAIPVLVVAGALDPKFVTLAERLTDGVEHATLVVVPRSGHTVHLEQPDAFHAALDGWLAATDQVRG